MERRVGDRMLLKVVADDVDLSRVYVWDDLVGGPGRVEETEVWVRLLAWRRCIVAFPHQ